VFLKLASGGIVTCYPELPLLAPERPHNFAWGDDDGKALYLCAKTVYTGFG